MSEKMWYKAAKIIVRASGNPLFQANETLVNILKSLLNEDQGKFILNFRKPRLSFQDLKEKTGMEDDELMNMLNSLMDNGIIMDWPIENSDMMEYRLLPPVADTFEYSLVRFDRPLEQKKYLANLYEKMFEEATEVTQSNYEGLMPIFKDKMPVFARIIPIEKEITVPQEKILPLHEASKIIDQQDIISLSECPCKLQKDLIGEPCQISTDINRCIHFGNIGRYFIDHNLGKQISREEAKQVLKEAEADGLVHKTFHDDFELDQNENAICNCCKDCCILFQSYYRGVFAFHTLTSYITELNEEKCKGCGTCVEKCPIEALSLINGKSQHDEKKCIGCGVCTTQCPEGARSLKRTELREIYIPPPRIRQ
ncbi:MAG: 4Fe-4S dicluster domain-containing protein [Candidatus Lokiarchaeota archaeon]|nr:4Fe-4S dicluster domain-containing protein [Candidatus Lokiarchaeota archaeon]MBD3199572.1 4Fe-4S dicluster domain-containing protein [Candidatus Lokiarchaeota archaeon]